MIDLMLDYALYNCEGKTDQIDLLGSTPRGRLYRMAAVLENYVFFTPGKACFFAKKFLG